jgi:hypothetical protein
MELPRVALDMASATVWAALPEPVVPAGVAAVVELDLALGVDDPQAAAMRPTTATAARADRGRATFRRRGGRDCDGVLAALSIGRYLPEDGLSARLVSR